MNRDRLPELKVPRCTSDPARPWDIPTRASRFPLSNSEDGSPIRFRTEGSIFRDDENLIVIFDFEDDDEIVATMLQRDEPLWKEDVVEIFLSPDSLDRYYEIEVSPIGTLFDARVRFPGPTRETMSVDVAWNCEGLAALVRSRPDERHLRTEIRITIPFTGLTGVAPRSGDLWRGNFYRIDRARAGDSFCAWSPTGANPPDFHVPSRFGLLRFE